MADDDSGTRFPAPAPRSRARKPAADAKPKQRRRRTVRDAFETEMLQLLKLRRMLPK